MQDSESANLIYTCPEFSIQPMEFLINILNLHYKFDSAAPLI